MGWKWRGRLKESEVTFQSFYKFTSKIKPDLPCSNVSVCDELRQTERGRIGGNGIYTVILWKIGYFFALECWAIENHMY